MAFDDDRLFDHDPSRSPDPAEWLALDEDERRIAVEEAHDDPPDWHPEAGNWTLHAALHVIVENQLAEDDPPATRVALTRLLAEGLDRHDAIHALASVVIAHIHAALRDREAVDVAALTSDLASLTAASWKAQVG